MTGNVGTFDSFEVRGTSLVTPVSLFAEVADSATTVYTGKTGQFFLIRHFVLSNTTGGALTVSVDVGTDTYVEDMSVAANSTALLSTLTGLLIPDGVDIEATGSAAGIVAFGWGLRVGGSHDWIL